MASTLVRPLAVAVAWVVVQVAHAARAQEPDHDRDGIPDSADVCASTADRGQLDSDLDGYGNACDADYDGDGIVGSSDFVIFSRAYESVEGSSRWDPNVDCDGDDRVGEADFECLRSRFLAPIEASGLSCAGAVPCTPGCSAALPACDPRVLRLDCGYEPIAFVPSYGGCTGKLPGPRILVDSTHSSYGIVPDFAKGSMGRYWGFARLLSADGYEVRESGVPLVQLLLPGMAEFAFLVIAAPRRSPGLPDAPPAFTPAEIGAVREWVARGGSLLLVMDHEPFDEAADLLTAFFSTVAVAGPTPGGAIGPYSFVRGSAELDTSSPTADALLDGVDVVQTFSGAAFLVADPVAPPATLRTPPQVIAPLLRFRTPTWTTRSRIDISGHLQGLAFTFGHGRVYVSGEAAMFTAQMDALPYGMNAATPPYFTEPANQNQELLRNVAHWLDRSHPDHALPAP